MKSFGKTFDLLIVLLIVRILPDLAGLVSNYIFPLIKSFDPVGTFAWKSVHHIVQFIFTIILMKLWFRAPLRELGFNLSEFRISIKLFGWTTLGFIVLVFLNDWLPPLISGEPPSYPYELNGRNMASVLSFQILLSGTCEEPLFRGFVILALAKSWNGTFNIGKLEVPVTGLWATLFFMFAHIGISVNPLAISHFSIQQQILSLTLGLYYAILFHKTRSLAGPMFYHGYSNVIIIGSLYILAFLMS